MSKKILLADDSKTIQKVVKITLSAEPYKIEIAEDEAQLNHKLSQGGFSLVLLDFGLSESKSGYELASEVVDLTSGVPTVLLFGTFDSVDDRALEDSGASDKIIKPFDSQHFLKMCANLVSKGHASKPMSLPTDSPIEEVDEWVMDTGDVVPPSPMGSEFNQAMSDWSFEVPPVIGNSEVEEDRSNTDDVPPVINEKDTGDITQAFEIPEELSEEPVHQIHVEEAKVPQAQDLDYPEPIEDSSLTIESNESTSEEEDFWSIDETVTNTEVPMEVDEIISEPPIEEKVEEVAKVDITDSLPSMIQAPMPTASEIAASIDMNDLVEQLKPFFEERIRTFCEENIEKVSWEVIPDLAENLIKKELSEIRNSSVE